MKNFFHTTLAALSLGIALAAPLSHRITRRTQAMGRWPMLRQPHRLAGPMC